MGFWGTTRLGIFIYGRRKKEEKDTNSKENKLRHKLMKSKPVWRGKRVDVVYSNPDIKVTSIQ
jgi:hypothetical protein